jgi:hypothetical protein
MLNVVSETTAKILAHRSVARNKKSGRERNTAGLPDRMNREKETRK